MSLHVEGNSFLKVHFQFQFHALTYQGNHPTTQQYIHFMEERLCGEAYHYKQTDLDLQTSQGFICTLPTDHLLCI